MRELAAYCTEPGRGPYVWWRAPAWAGKSALMSTFVLHPPAGVRVVAFFITARLGAQDTREAFTEVVLEQLAELLGQDLPPLTAATRDAHLLGMLEQAAQACAAKVSASATPAPSTYPCRQQGVLAHRRCGGEVLSPVPEHPMGVCSSLRPPGRRAMNRLACAHQSAGDIVSTFLLSGGP